MRGAVVAVAIEEARFDLGRRPVLRSYPVQVTTKWPPAQPGDARLCLIAAQEGRDLQHPAGLGAVRVEDLRADLVIAVVDEEAVEVSYRLSAQTIT